jgi:thiamine pyrophosphokinase
VNKAFIMRAVIVANGTMSNPADLPAFVSATGLLICADGGSRHVAAAGLIPDVVIGDLDSIDPRLADAWPGRGCEFIAYPAAKDETDLELALCLAMDRGATEIVVLGALGGRTDQTLANILLLVLPAQRGIHARIVDGREEICLITTELTVTGQAGDILSLIPLGGDAVGITTEGLEYPLHGETLRFGPAHGISNVLTGPVARVRLERGLLLAVHTRLTE